MGDSARSLAYDPRMVTRQFAVSKDMTLTADVWGEPNDSPPVVLLHGGGQTRHAWQGTGETLARDGWHVLSFDLRGHGDSLWATDEDYSMSAFAGDVVGITELLGNKPILVGASIGGLTSMLAIGETDHPIASGLVLVDIAAKIEEKTATSVTIPGSTKAA